MSDEHVDKDDARAIALLLVKTLAAFLTPLVLVALFPVLGYVAIVLILVSMVVALLVACVRERRVDEANRTLYEAIEAICVSTGNDYEDVAGSITIPCHELERHRILFDLPLADDPRAAALVRDNAEALERELIDRLPEFDKADVVESTPDCFLVECRSSKETEPMLLRRFAFWQRASSLGRTETGRRKQK